MSYDPDFEKRINNKIETIVETQANLQEAVASLIQVERIQNVRAEENNRQIAGLIELARIHDEQIDRNSEQIASLIAQGKELDENIKALAVEGKGQRERIDALIRVVEGHISNHS
jgi:acetolactate synthase small subunit